MELQMFEFVIPMMMLIKRQGDFSSHLANLINPIQQYLYWLKFDTTLFIIIYNRTEPISSTHDQQVKEIDYVVEFVAVAFPLVTTRRLHITLAWKSNNHSTYHFRLATSSHANKYIANPFFIHQAGFIWSTLSLNRFNCFVRG